MGKITQSFSQMMKKFFNLVRALDPVLKPLTDFFVKFIIKGVDNMMAFVDAIGMALGGTEGFKNIIGGVVDSFMQLFVIVQDAMKSIGEGFGTKGEAAAGIASLIKNIFSFISLIFKLTGAIIKLLNKMGLFKAIGTIFKGIFVVLNTIFKVINAIIEKIIQAFDFINKKAEEHPVIAKALHIRNPEAGAIPTPASSGGGNSNSVTNNTSTTINTQSLDGTNANTISDMISGKIAQNSKIGL